MRDAWQVLFHERYFYQPSFADSNLRKCRVFFYSARAGDCCECDCVIPADASEDQLAYSCVQFSCDDTSSACYVVPAPTPTPVAASDDGDTVETAENAATTATAAVSTTATALAVTLISGAAAFGW